jgi:hypothetical protein
MTKTLLFTAMLLLPIIAYGGNPSADLSVQVVPAGSGSGALPGSTLPPGNWVNDLDEHFSGTSLNTNIWTAGVNNLPGSGGVSNCQVSGALSINNGATLSPLPPYQGQSNGCAVYSGYSYSTPGYFEAYLQTDTGTNVWNGIFFEMGPNASCQGDYAANGGEVDLAEAFTAGIAQESLWYNGYASCFAGGVLRKNLASSDAYHVWGMDYGDNNMITFYRDGVLIAQYAPGDGVEPGSCGSLRNCSNGTWLGQFILWDYGWQGGTASNPSGLRVAWVRHYHH